MVKHILPKDRSRVQFPLAAPQAEVAQLVEHSFRKAGVRGSIPLFGSKWRIIEENKFMAEFKRSRLERKSEEQITKKTFVLGLLTVIVFVLVIAFGLPFLIKFSVFFGEAKIKKEGNVAEKVLPPLPPRIVLPYDATSSSKINISGFAEAKVEVELLKNDVSFGKTNVSDAGDFSFSDVGLDEGENVFTTVATSEKGGSSEPSKQLVITFDNKAPEFTMLNPSTDNIKVDLADFEISGQSEKGVSVLVNNQVAIVDDTGKFKIKVQLNAGKNDIEVKVRDAAGNETKKNIVITYDV